MGPAESFMRMLRHPAKRLFDDGEDELNAYIKGPLFPRAVFYALLATFGIFVMLSVDWFGLLLLNSEGVFRQIGTLNTLRVTAALMAGVAIPSALLMLHYRGLYTYISEENVFFTITFSISFMMGFPCALVGIFG